jgi:hypothetical protein
LRSRVWCEDGVPCLRLAQDRPMAAAFVDVSGEPAADPTVRVEELLHRAIYTPFEGDQVYRATVLKTSNREYLVAVVAHHFVVDGFACEILARELAASLREEHHSSSATEERPLQYSDYLLGMSEWLSGRGPTYRLAFWAEKMRGAPPVRFPPASVTNSSAVPKAENIVIQVSTEVRASIARAAATHRMPLQTVLLAAKFAALSQTLHSSDLVVTVLYWGRDDPALLELVGFTVNCLSVRVRVLPELTYLDLLTDVHNSYLLARDYQVPWTLLTRSFPDIGASSAAPLFNYIYVASPVVNKDSPPRPAAGLQIERVPVYSPDDHISVDWKTHEFNISDDGKELNATLRYIPSRYESAAAREFANAFLRCLEAIGRDATQSIASGEPRGR